MSLISVVIPAFNESQGIQLAIRTIAEVMRATKQDFELIVVDDGSRDATYDQAATLVDELPLVALRLSRNFGKEAALLAGLQQARGEAVITIDADLQHPPNLIPDMIVAWQHGAKIVHGVKRDRGNESWWAKARAAVTYKLISALGGIDVHNSSDFKLLDRSVVQVIVHALPERSRFYRGLASWVGFTQATLQFDVAERVHGVSGWSLRALLRLFMTALVSFTSAPLRLVTIMGVLTFLLGVAVGGDALWSWLNDATVSGFTTIIITLLLIGSFIMFSLGIIGEYIAKIYDEIKQRPAFIIEKTAMASSKDE